MLQLDYTSDRYIAAQMAYSLCHLSYVCFHLKHTEESLAAGRRALEIQRKWRFYKSQLIVLLNMSHFLWLSGRYQEASTVMEEAAGICASVGPQWLAQWCTSRLSRSYLVAGKVDKALAASRRALENSCDTKSSSLPRCLNPRPSSLQALSKCLASMGRKEEALAAIEEAVKLWRSWPQRLEWGEYQFMAYEHIDLLHDFSMLLAAAGRSKKALITIMEAVKSCHVLVAACPVYLPQLPRSLRTCATHLWDMCHREESVVISKQAIKIWCSMVSTPTEAYLAPLYCELLDEFTVRLIELGQLSEAESIRAEAESIRATIPEPQKEVLKAEEYDAESAEKITISADSVTVQPIVEEGTPTTSVEAVAEVLVDSPKDTASQPHDEIEQPTERLDEYESSVHATRPSLPTSTPKSSDPAKSSPPRDIPKTIRQTITFLSECAAVVWLFMTAWNYFQSQLRNVDKNEK